MTWLQITWFILVGVLLAGYTVLSGFDLGAGHLLYRFRNPEEREEILYNLKPIWGVNQVWLLTGGGALFAAFPRVYAGVFSGFYLALMLLLLALILRSVAIEIDHEIDSPGWTRSWEKAFLIGSSLVCLLLGVAMGNLLVGLPLDENGYFSGTFLELLNVFALLTGIFAVCLFGLQGAGFIIATSRGTVQEKAYISAQRYWMASFVIFVLLSLYCLLFEPQVFVNYQAYPVIYLIPVLLVSCLIYYPAALKKSISYLPVLVSSLLLISLWGVLGASMFPALVPNTANPVTSLTLFNSSSSELTLKVMLILALCGLPLVFFYIAMIYRQFFARNAAQSTVNQNSAG